MSYQRDYAAPRIERDSYMYGNYLPYQHSAGNSYRPSERELLERDLSYQSYRPVFEEKSRYHDQVERSIDKKIEEKEDLLRKYSSLETSKDETINFNNQTTTRSAKTNKSQAKRLKNSSSSKQLTCTNSAHKYEHMVDPYSKYNTKSPYARSTFATSIRSMDKQPYTFSEKSTSRRNSVTKKTTKKDRLIQKLVSIIEDHSQMSPQIKIRLDSLRNEFPNLI